MIDWLYPLRRWLLRKPRAAARCRQANRQPRFGRSLTLELLENRVVPANIDFTRTDNLATEWLIRFNTDESQVEVLAKSTGDVDFISQGFVPTGPGNTLTINGEDGFDDTITIDFAFGGFFQLDPMTLIGGTGGGDDTVIVVGTGTVAGSTTAIYTPSGTVNGSGQVKVTEGAIETVMNFSELNDSVDGNHLAISSMFSLQYVTPNKQDNLTMDGVTVGATPSTKITGTSEAVTLTNMVFHDVNTFTLNTGANDSLAGTSANDSVTVTNDGLQAQGMQNVTITTGIGADTLIVQTNDFRLPVAGGSFTYDAGEDSDTLNITAPGTYFRTNGFIRSKDGADSRGQIDFPGNTVQTVTANGRTMGVTSFTADDGAATTWLVRLNAGQVEVLANNVVQGTVPVGVGNAFTIFGENNQDDTVTVDFTNGFFQLDSMTINGGTGTGTDRLTIIGTGTAAGSTTALYVASGTTTGDGFIQVTGPASVNTQVNFASIDGMVRISKMSSLNYRAPLRVDVLNLASGTGPGSEKATVISGTSDGITLRNLLFFDVTTLTVDTAFNDIAGQANDHVTIESDGLQARGLKNFTYTAGSGADTLTVKTSDFRLPESGGTFTFDGNGTSTSDTAIDSLIVEGGGSFVLDNFSLRNSGRGQVNFLNSGVEFVSITGDDGDDSLEINGWTRSGAFQGGDGTDRLLILNVASATLTDATLTLGAGAAFGLSSIERVLMTAANTGSNLDASGYTLGPVTLIGNAGNDTLKGGAGDDLLDGGAGNDVLSGGAGNDTLKGGAGRDRVVDTYNTAVITIKNGSITAGAEIDTLVAIEEAEITGGDANNKIDAATFTLGSVTLNGGAGNDTLIGTDFNDALQGGEGNDSLLGGKGNDILGGGPGNDTLNGGAGNDRLVEVVEGDTPVTITLAAASMTGLGTDVLISIETADITGGDGNDVITVTSFGGRTTLRGGDGDDVLTGGAQNDLLIGGQGKDVLNGGAGNDTLQGGPDDDTLNGGAGDDTVMESGDFSMFLSNTQLTGAGIDTLISIERAHLIGGAGNNQLDARDFTRGPVTLNGSGGNDSLFGGSRNDSLIGGDGDDIIDGGAGHDTLEGGAGSDFLTGGAGNDVLRGGDGSDTMDGGAGHDRLTGGGGDDSMIGGAGIDTVVETGDVNMTLTNSELAGGDVLGTTKGFEGIERAILRGGASANTINASTFNGRVTLQGGGGNDKLFGGKNNDLLLGGAGNDSLSGGAGNDTLNGGAGRDTANGGAGFDKAIACAVLKAIED